MGTIDCYTTLGAPRTQAPSFSAYLAGEKRRLPGAKKPLHGIFFGFQNPCDDAHAGVGEFFFFV